jgi:hypothetical protein
MESGVGGEGDGGHVATRRELHQYQTMRMEVDEYLRRCTERRAEPADAASTTLGISAQSSPHFLLCYPTSSPSHPSPVKSPHPVVGVGQRL